jgi:NADH-ubiquinone oxidoreductase chain 4
MLIAANIAAPPSINLASEIILIGRIIRYDLFVILLFPLGSFMGAVYSLFIYSYSQHGKIYELTYGNIIGDCREFHTLIIHILPLNLLVVGLLFFFS